MGTETVKDMVLPRGVEGLEPEGGWPEGKPLVDEAGRAAINQEVGRIQALDTAERVARGTARQEVRAALDQDKATKAGQLKAFKSFLWSLEELAGRDAGAVADPTETRLVFRLFRLEDQGGVKPQAVYQTAVSFGASEALAMGDPDLEGRAQAWAEKAGRFGRYQWRLLGWAAGEQTLDTTFNVTTEPPPGYEAPKVLPAEVQAERPKDPVESLKDSLGLIGMVKDALGLGQAGKVDTESIRSSARLEAQLDAERANRAELQRLEDRWEAKLETAKAEAYKRGTSDGRREAEDEWRPKLWELERQMAQGKEPSMIEEAVRMVGGPDVVQAMARTFLSAQDRPAQAPRQVVPLRRPAPAPAVHLNPMSQPQVPGSQPATAPQGPSRKGWREALEQTEEALEILAEHDDGSAETQQLREVLKAFLEQGEADGDLTAWWQAWNQVIRGAVAEVLRAVEQSPEEGMDMEGMKNLLAARLAEGATDAAILEELGQLTSSEQRAGWRETLAWVPESAVVQMIGGDPERAQGLLAAFMAGD